MTSLLVRVFRSLLATGRGEGLAETKKEVYMIYSNLSMSPAPDVMA